MKTLTKMFLLSCWCLFSVSFAKETLDELKAKQEQQLIQEKLDILIKEKDQVKENISNPESDCEEVASPVLIPNKYEIRDITVPNYSNDGINKDAILEAKEAYLNNKGNETAEPLSIEALNNIGKEIKEEILAKGYTVEEYMDAVNADRIANQKDGAVSYETYLDGLNAKEQAIVLEYILQSPSNNAGDVVNNNYGPKIPEKILNEILEEKARTHEQDAAYWDNFKTNPPQAENSNRDYDCVNDDSVGDSYGDTCSSWYDAYPSSCGGYDTDEFVAAELCCACGGGESVCNDNEVFFNLVDSYGDGWNGGFLTFDGTDMTIADGSEATFAFCLDAGDYTYTYTAGSWSSENSFTVTDTDGNVLSSGNNTATDYGFSVGGTVVEGCTDSAAENFNADANVDDGSCTYSCDWWLAGPSASCYNYVWNYGYTVDTMIGYGYECNCVEDPVYGCTDSESSDYNADADLDDGSCTYPCDGLVVDMVDAWGDGWNGNVLTIGDQSFTIDSGSAAQGCYTGATEDVTVTCGGGSYQSEVSWTISDADGNVLLSGGAPYDGILNPSAPPTCDDETACNTGAEGDCEYAATGYNCDGSCADGYENDCSGACASSSTIASWQGDGYCDDGAYGLYLNCCDFNFDDGDCGASMGCDGVAVDCGGAVNDDCGECGGDNSSCADCAGVANGDAWVDCAGSCLDAYYLSYLGDGYCDDGAWGVDLVSCADFNCDNGDCGTELIDGSCQSSGCSDDQFTCANGDCIPAGYYCDGSSEWGNAGWGPDCADGSDELFDECCEAGAYAADLCDPPPTCSDYTWTCGGGSWGSEVSWTIDAGSDALVASGGVGEGTFCAEDGDVTFSACDAYGDGWNGNTFVLSDADGNVVFSSAGPSADLAGGECSAETLTLGGEPPVSGCTDAGAPNYNPDATIDDGSCEAYCNADELYSCAYYLATGNYSCETLEGYGYDCSMCADECPVEGCTDETASNYNPDATMNDGSCTYDCSGLTVSMCDSYGDGWNGNVLTIGDESFSPATGDPCEEACYTGATDNVAVSCDGGSWQSEVSWSISDGDGNQLLAGGAPYYGVLNPSGDIEGCTDPAADNYNPDATIDDGSCVIDDTCDSCEFDWTAYGAECCDAAWDVYGIDCATLEANYNWDCSGCACPGDPTCEDQGLVTCDDGSCAASSDDCGGGGDLVDCQGNDYTGYESWIGDGFCDDGSWGFYFNCAEFDCDAGDCATDCAGVCGGDAVVGCDGECGSGLEFDECGDCGGDGSGCECVNYTLVVGGGAYDSEMAWTLEDGDGNALYSAGCEDGTATTPCEGGGNGTFDICVYDGFYTMYGYDSWGDGWNGGYWEMFDADGNSVAGGPDYTVTEDNYYGWAWGWGLCLGACGCTEPSADNYDPDATINDWSCTFDVGSDCAYWGYPGYFVGCGGVHCYSQDEIDADAGNGNCNAHAADGCEDDPFCHGLACEYYSCDGGDCSQGDDPDGECYVEPQTCDGLTVNMFDSYGDGWNGNVLTIGTESFTIESGDSAVGCYTGPTDVVVTCDGGSWQSEVSWNISDADGNELLAGGAPYSGCLGNCDSVVFGCTDDTACNYNPDADSDDGTCEYPALGCDCDSPDSDGDGICDDGYDCYNPSWYADGYCDSSNNVAECGYDGGDCCPGDCVDATYECETYGGDCSDCIDPNSADNAEGGECDTYSGGCTDPNADNYDPDATEDDGTCLYDGCPEGQLADCSGDGDCASATWVGDGLCDGEDQAYGVDFSCYGCDGGDCGTPNEAGDGCGDPTVWDAEITNLTAEGADYYGYSAVQWDWDDLSDGEEPLDCAAGWDACVESLAGTEYYEACGAEDCEGGSGGACDGDVVPYLTDECGAFVNYVVSGDCADPCPGSLACDDGSDPLVDCIGVEYCNDACANTSYTQCTGCSAEDEEAGTCNDWIGDGYCDDGSYGLEFACSEFDCDGCDCGSEYSSNGDGCNEGCTDPGEGTDAAVCAASFVAAGSDGETDCYSDGSGYFSFSWDGGCLATEITYSGGTLDLTAYNFTDGFVFYGFDPGSCEEFLVFFNGDYDNAAVSEACSDCPVPETCEDNGLVTCPDGSCVEAGTDCPDFTCGDDEWMCASGDQCIPASYVCDGSSEFCNASWGPDCADGSDEGVEFCGYADECEDDGGDDGSADGCEWDASNYGADDCDAAWDIYGLDCATLAANYGWDCTGCDCPGDADDGGDDGGSAAEDCAAAGGHYCGDDESNWTSYSPNGCVPDYYICDGWDDCVDASDEANCDGRSSETANILSTDQSVNAKHYSHAIEKYKRSTADGMIMSANKTLNTSVDASIMINALTGEITYSDNYSNDNREVSYTINVSCDTCLSGGPWSGAWEVAQSDFLVYGFDTGSNVCANVVGNSTLLGSTAASGDACADAGAGDDCASGYYDCAGVCDGTSFEDCAGQCVDLASWVGDGYCDDGTYGAYFNCDEFNCDEGDCAVECWDGSSACSGNTECPEEPACTAGDVNGDEQVNVTDIVSIVNFILGGGSDAADLDCGDMNADDVINVTDIVSVVNYILGGGTAMSSNTTYDVNITINDDQLHVSSDGNVQGIQLTLSHDSDFEIELMDVNGGLEVAEYNTIDENTTIVVIVSSDLGNKPFATTKGDFVITEKTVVDEFAQEMNVKVTEIVDFSLKAAYPNPFNPSTTLELVLPEAGYVSIKVYNLVGQEVATLADGMMEANPSGHVFQWNASGMASGVYLVRAEGAGQISTQKLMLLK